MVSEEVLNVELSKWYVLVLNDVSVGNDLAVKKKVRETKKPTEKCIVRLHETMSDLW